MGSLQGSLGLVGLLVAVPVLACEYPDQGSTPMRAAVSAVRQLPVTETWEHSLPRGSVTQFVLHLDRPRTVEGRCHWTLEVKLGGEVWKQFLVTPGGGRAIEDPSSKQ